MPPSSGITVPVRYEPAREASSSDQPGDVVGAADAPERHRLLDRLAALGLVEQERHHLALERPRGDRVDGDVLAGEALGEVAREHVHGGLARAVAVVLKRRRAQAVDRADVDHARGSSALGRGAQRPQQRDRQVKDALDVGVRDLVPAAGGKLLERRAPRGAGVVDEDVERGEALLGRTRERDRALAAWRRRRGSRGSRRAVRARWRLARRPRACARRRSRARRPARGHARSSARSRASRRSPAPSCR